MDNRITNNISFQATLVTQIKGRNNIMTEVAERFSKISKNSNHELRIERVPEKYLRENPGCGEFLLTVDGKESYITSALHELISNAQPATKEEIENVAQRLNYTMKAMLYKQKFEDKYGDIAVQIRNLGEKIKKVKRFKTSAEKEGDEDLFKTCNGMIKSFEAKLTNLNAEYCNAQKKLFKDFDAMIDKGLNLGKYKNYVKNDIDLINR